MAPLLEMTGITRIYDNGILANDCVDISLDEREIHAIAGENGAGKSTVMKVLYGLETCDGGETRIRGEKADIRAPKDAMALGIGMVQQHFMLVNELTVYENIFLGQEIRRHGVLDRSAMIEKTRALGELYGMPVDPEKKCGELTVGMAQRVEILKVLARGAEILILDEPTAVLTPQETAQLFDQLRLLRENGHTCVIITHKLREITELCDRVTVMRAGKTVGTYRVAEVDENEISRLMVGRDVQLTLKKPPAKPGQTVLTVSGLHVAAPSGRPALNDVGFTVRAGEIVCLAGVEGNGQSEVVQCITGLRKNYDGSVVFSGQDLAPLDIKHIRKLGVAHIPEDRMARGVNPSADILDNLISVKIDRSTRAGFVRYHELGELADIQTEHYQIRAAGNRQRIDMLSGGNIQKVVVAREMEENPELLVADQPTRGVDVGAMELIHNRLLDLRSAGSAVLLISSDMSEVFNLADRILVFHEGEITAEITDVKSLSEEQLGRYMLGLERMEVPNQ